MFPKIACRGLSPKKQKQQQQIVHLKHVPKHNLELTHKPKPDNLVSKFKP